jgi:hypothetical protein
VRESEPGTSGRGSRKRHVGGPSGPLRSSKSGER